LARPVRGAPTDRTIAPYSKKPVLIYEKRRLREMTRTAIQVITGLLSLLPVEFAVANPIRQVLSREVAKAAGKAVIREAEKEIAECVSRLVARYGDDAIRAVGQVGPSVVRVVEEAGPHGSKVIKLLAQHGEKAVWIIQKPQAMAIFIRYGDDAAEALVRHGEMALPLIDDFGTPAAKAMQALSPQNARRLAIMHRSGELTRLGRQEELLDVVTRYGDRAMEFIWRNKGALAVGAALTAFLMDPEGFLNGVKSLVDVVGEHAIRPVTETPARLAEGVVKTVNWTVVLPVVVALSLGYLGFRLWLKAKRVPAVAAYK
jgi:hypothetical protein